MITRQADYAVRSVLDLALRPDEQAAFSRDIAERQSIPGSFVAKILTRLARVGIVQTQRGITGGVRLSRPANEISLLEVIEAIDGPIALNLCVRGPDLCPLEENCRVHPIWDVLNIDLRQRLGRISFADLVEAEGRWTLELVGGA
ncbi:MAG TPA: Rrf2 family transcriptional regulator [Anaerolineales bacterium]|nr:Rrf2 family transcriptional regulator [Anaerolineales bacterium]